MVQQIANMNHIVVNNYTNAGLSILFLIVVYSIIFYGFKTWLAVRNSDKRTDKETPYVPSWKAARRSLSPLTVSQPRFGGALFLSE